MKKLLPWLFALSAVTIAEKAMGQGDMVNFADPILLPIPPKSSEKLVDIGRAVKGRQYLDAFVTPQYDTLVAVPDEKGGTVMVWGLRSVYNGTPGSALGEVRLDTNGFDFMSNYYAIFNDNQFEVLSMDTVKLTPYDPKEHGKVTWQKAGQKGMN